MNKIVDCKVLKEKLLSEYKQEIDKMDKLKLTVIQIGNDQASSVYINNKKKTCEKVGIDFEHLKYDDIKEADLIKEIKRLNNDKSVTGILVQLPLPNSLNKEKVIDAINPLKDVDGLTKTNRENLKLNKEGLVPCTALGIMEILKYLDIELENKNIAVMGRSILVGKPVSILLENEKAIVTVCHSKTENIKDITTKADILVVAIGKPKLVDKTYIKEDATVIDVGINRVGDKLYGDCDFDEIYEKCKFITPVPGGVGQLTTTMLVFNIIKAYKLQNKIK